MKKNNALNEKLVDLKSSLPAMILADHFIMRPDMAERYTKHQKDNFQKDVAWILSFLSEAVWAKQPVLFEEFIAWLKTFLSSVRVPMKDVAESIELIQRRINEICTAEENDIINPILSKAIRIILSDEQIVSIPAMDNHLSPLAQEYLDNLLKGNRNSALNLVLDKVKTGSHVKEMYLEIFQPVQYEIGRLWQTNKISVAQEHYCTGATQLVMSQLYPYLFTGVRKERKMVTTCVSGELHEMGARMVTDFFEMQGWDTYYLGANMPIEGVINFLSETKPECLAISATMTFHVSAVEEMIRMIKSSPAVSADLKIIVGGYPFKVAGGLWKNIGADGYAPSAEEAVDLADKLTAA
ncbi:MAG: cobalamin-dependent protein [Bacteroidales bacterium]|nr:cobalamin-dependent protein [Bacteroidales bacterium]